MANKDIINAVIGCAENKGWHVYVCDHPTKDEVMFEFSKFTPAVQDFSSSATMQNGCLDSFIREVEEYYEGFNPDEETYLWLDERGHGLNGVPYRMKGVLADMEAAERMVADFLIALQNLEDEYAYS